MTKQEYLKHEDSIKEWAKGSKIEYYDVINKEWIPADNPSWSLEIQYRVKIEKPKWEDFGKVSGYCASPISGLILKKEEELPTNRNKLAFPTKEEAEACLALSQLCQWRDKYNEGWKPDWSFHNERKYTIYIENNEITTGLDFSCKSVLSFKTKEIRDEFLADFKDLIEIAKPLL